MEEVINLLSSPVWWFSVVLVGIAINILASYIKPKVDNLFSSSSSWWRNRSEKQKSIYKKQLEELKHNEKKQLLSAVTINHLSNLAIILILISIIPVIWLGLAWPETSNYSVQFRYLTIVTLSFSGIVFFCGYLVMRSSNNERRMLYEAIHEDNGNS